MRQAVDAEYAKSEAGGDPIGTTVWGRVSEQVRKLALIHAASAAPMAPVIDRAAVDWATAFMLHQTRHTLPQAASHVASTPFEGECLKCLRWIKQNQGQEVAHQKLLKRMHMNVRDFTALISALEQRGEVITKVQSNGGRPGRFYFAP